MRGDCRTPEWALTGDRDLQPRWRMKRLWFLGLLTPLVLAGCASSNPVARKSPGPVVRTSAAVAAIPEPSESPSKGWRRYENKKAGYALYRPATWRYLQPQEDQYSLEQNFSPGPDPYTGPVWLSVDSVTHDQLISGGFPDCRHDNVSGGEYRFAGQFEIGGRAGFRYSSAPPPGFSGEPSYGMVVTVEAVGRCFRFEGFSPTLKDWNANSATTLRILSTVTFRP